jgi:hypothetical protein
MTFWANHESKRNSRSSAFGFLRAAKGGVEAHRVRFAPEAHGTAQDPRDLGGGSRLFVLEADEGRPEIGPDPGAQQEHDHRDHLLGILSPWPALWIDHAVREGRLALARLEPHVGRVAEQVVVAREAREGVLDRGRKRRQVSG